MIHSVLELFRTRLARTVPSPDTDLFATGVLDSLSLIELLVELETAYGVTLDIATLDLDQLRTVRGIAALVAPEKSASLAA